MTFCLSALFCMVHMMRGEIICRRSLCASALNARVEPALEEVVKHRLKFLFAEASCCPSIEMIAGVMIGFHCFLWA